MEIKPYMLMRRAQHKLKHKWRAPAAQLRLACLHCGRVGEFENLNCPECCDRAVRYNRAYYMRNNPNADADARPWTPRAKPEPTDEPTGSQRPVWMERLIHELRVENPVEGW